MGKGMHKLIVIGAVVAALGLVAPAFGKLALPEGYALPSTEPTVYSPQAVKALGERGQAMARFYEASTVYSPQAVKALGERGQAMAQLYGTAAIVSRDDANQGRVDPVAPLDLIERQVAARPVVSAADSSSFDWNSVGIGVGTAALLAALGLVGLLGLRARSTVAHP